MPICFLWKNCIRVACVRFFCGILLCLAVGCSHSPPDGPPRYALSGTVTFNGKPIPNGMIRFIPDTEKGNRGPGAMTDIRNGKYQTLSGKGTVGGPMIIEITGFDGVAVELHGETMEAGAPLFEPYRIEIDLPLESTTQDFDVPPSASGKKSPSR